ncbi:MAG TPA: hypothetical protein V6D14_18580 [Coleofasciculaceae cyanobacterium]|jgi:hypothetical protein
MLRTDTNIATKFFQNGFAFANADPENDYLDRSKAIKGVQGVKQTSLTRREE